MIHSSYSLPPDYLIFLAIFDHPLSFISGCDPDPGHNIQESLESNLFKKKKMSQAEKHRGWIRMRNLSNVKIAIQVSIILPLRNGVGIFFSQILFIGKQKGAKNVSTEL